MLSSTRSQPVSPPPPAWGLALAGCLLAMAALAGPSGAIAAQAPDDLDDYPALEPDDLDVGYRQWLEEQVVWIITPEEREVFLRLQSDAQRDLFIENFWKVRDPTPGTARNEYREVHYDRLDHANRVLGGDTSTPGSLTDRGRIWILLGEPRNRTRVEGRRLVPSEVWFYSVDPKLGTPPQFSLIFFRRGNFGEYRLWSFRVDGPEQLLTEGARQTLGSLDLASRFLAMTTGATGDAAAALVLLREEDPLLADAAESLVPGVRSGRGVAQGERLLSDLWDIPQVLLPSSDWAYSVLEGETESAVRFETLPMAAAATTLVRSDTGSGLHLAVRIPGDRLEVLDAGGEKYVSFELASTFRDASGEPLLLNTPRVLDAPLSDEMATLLDEREFQYVWSRDVPAEAARLELDVASVLTGEFGRAVVDLTSTAPEGAGLEAHRPFLVREVHNLSDAPPPVPHPFQLGQLLLVPAIDGPFAAGGVVGVYWQVHLVGEAPPTLIARFRLRDPQGAEAGEWVTPIDPARTAVDGIVNHLTRVSLEDVPPGSYVLECSLETGSGNAGRTVRLPLRVASPGEDDAPILYVQPNAPPETRR